MSTPPVGQKPSRPVQHEQTVADTAILGLSGALIGMSLERLGRGIFSAIKGSTQSEVGTTFYLSGIIGSIATVCLLRR